MKFFSCVRQTSIGVLLSCVAIFNLELEQLDAKTTFLHGDLKKDIYMRPLKGFIAPRKENRIYRLRKSIYGLKQWSHQWYKIFSHHFNDISH